MRRRRREIMRLVAVVSQETAMAEVEASHRLVDVHAGALSARLFDTVMQVPDYA
jgi:hypothetical protein